MWKFLFFKYPTWNVLMGLVLIVGKCRIPTTALYNCFRPFITSPGDLSFLPSYPPLPLSVSLIFVRIHTSPGMWFEEFTGGRGWWSSSRDFCWCPMKKLDRLSFRTDPTSSTFTLSETEGFLWLMILMSYKIWDTISSYDRHISHMGLPPNLVTGFISQDLR